MKTNYFKKLWAAILMLLVVGAVNAQFSTAGQGAYMTFGGSFWASNTNSNSMAFSATTNAEGRSNLNTLQIVSIRATTGAVTNKTVALDTPTFATINNQTRIHYIAYTKSVNAGAVKGGLVIGASNTAKASASPDLTTTWARQTVVYSTNASITYRPGFVFSFAANGNGMIVDDAIMYLSASNTTDLTAPDVAVPAEAEVAVNSGITWAVGTDNSGGTGVQNTLVWYKSANTDENLTLYQQGGYNAAGIFVNGVGQISPAGDWKLLAVLPAAQTTYTAAEEGLYAIVHRDLAYNYSAPAYVEVVAGGPNIKIVGETTIDFGSVPANGTLQEEITITGGMLEAGTEVSVSYPDGFSGEVTDGILTVDEAGDVSATITVTFDPAGDVDNWGGNIIFTSGDAIATVAVSAISTEADTTAPELSSINPNPPAKLPLSGTITVTFNEEIKLTGTMPQFNGVDGELVDNNKLVFTYSGLTQYTPYTLTIGNNVIADMSNNAFAGATWNWTSETPAPEIDLQSASENVAIKAGVAFSIIFDVYNVDNNAEPVIEVTGLPAGVSAAYTPGTPGSLTISGSASALATYPGIFNYTIIPTPMPGYDGETITADGTITVKDPNGKNVLYLIQANNAGYSATEQANDKLLQMIETNYEITVRNRKDTGASSNDDYSAYDLVVLHESINGADGGVAGNEAHEILDVDIPILNTKAYFYTNGRWGWGTPNNPGNTRVAQVLVPEHPIFAGITLNADNQFNMFNTATDKNMQYSTINNIGGTILAVPSGQADTNAAMHEVTAAQRGVATAGYLMISLLASNGDDLTDDALLLYKNACDYLMGISDTPTEEPLESFGIKWSKANINGQSITFDELKLQEGQTEAMEVYFEWAQGYENCLLFINETYVGNGAPIIWGEDNTGNGVFFDFGKDILEGLNAVIDIVRPNPSGAKGVQKAIDTVYPQGTTIASYTLTIPAEVVATGLGANKINGADVKDCFNVLGVQVDCESNGIVIKRFTDGSTKKTLNK